MTNDWLVGVAITTFGVAVGVAAPDSDDSASAVVFRYSLSMLLISMDQYFIILCWCGLFQFSYRWAASGTRW